MSAITKKKWSEPVHDLGEWDTAVTDTPADTQTTPNLVALPEPEPDAAEAAEVSEEVAAPVEAPAVEAIDDAPPVPLVLAPPEEGLAADDAPVRVATPEMAARRPEPAPVAEAAPETPSRPTVSPGPARSYGPDAAPDPGPATVIGPSITVRGRLSTQENLVVRGRIDAEVRSTRTVRIEPTGVVNANMDVHTATIDGILAGNVRATELVELLPNARVVGDIVTPRLIVHEGALLRGRVDMNGLQALEILKRSPVQAQPRKPVPPPAPPRHEPPPPAAREPQEWDGADLSNFPVRPAAVARVPVEPIAARLPPEPAVARVRADGGAPLKLEPAAPPPRPRPVAPPVRSSSDKTPGEPGEKGSWFRGRG